MPKLVYQYEPHPRQPEAGALTHFVRPLLNLLSPGGPNARLSILIYHRVLPQRDPLFPSELDAQDFNSQMRLLKACFNIIPLTDAIRGIRQGNLPPRSACITFDDGYADNAEVALPILKKYDIPATFFIATGFLDGGRMWNDTVIELVRRASGEVIDLTAMRFDVLDIATPMRRRQTINTLLKKLKYLPFDARQTQIEHMCSLVPVDLPSDLMMSSEQVRKLHSSGMEIGGHTVNHPILTRLDRAAAEREIATGKTRLEEIIRAPLRLFAYPNGKPIQDYQTEHVQLVKELGFEGAVSTAWGAGKSNDDVYQLPRFTPWDRAQLKFTMRLALNTLRRAQTV